MNTDQLHELMPWAADLGLELLDATADEVRGRVEWRERLCTAAGVLHGGVVIGLADAVGAVCAFLNLPPDSTTTTIESKTNFFRPVKEGHAEAVASPLHRGKTTIVVQTNVSDATGRAVAQVTQTQAVLPAG